MIFSGLIGRLIGRKLKDQLDLEEGPVDKSKPWYKSQTIIAAIVGILFNAYEGIATGVGSQVGWNLPSIPPILVTIVNSLLGGTVIHGRVKADTAIGSPAPVA